MSMRLVVIVSILLVAQTSAQSNEKPNLGRVMWSAFSCAVYAEISGERAEQKRLFKVGYEAGRKFLAGIEKKTVSEADLREAPIGVTMLLSGPTSEFVIGRIFESATRDAYDDVVKEDDSGLPILDPTKWANGEVKKLRAENKFRSSNCELIR